MNSMLKQISNLGTSLSKTDLKSITGGRTVVFTLDGEGGCTKVIFNNEGNIIKSKSKDRYTERC